MTAAEPELWPKARGKRRGFSWGAVEPGANTTQQTLLAFIVYLLLAFALFARGLVGAFSDRFLGRGTDAPFYIWSFAWWSHVFHSGANPFLTKLLWAPHGFNLTWMASVPLLTAIAAPLTNAVGPVATYNASMLLTVPIAGISVHLLCRQLGASFSGALLGGLVLMFSPFMENELLYSHVNLLLVFPIPLAVYLVSRRATGTLSRTCFVPLLTAVLCTQFLFTLEPFATATLIGAIAVVVAIVTGPKEIRAQSLILAAEIGVSYTLAAVVVSPYLHFFFLPGLPSHPIWPAADFSVDLLNFALPNNLSAIGMTLHGSIRRYAGQPAWIAAPFVLVAFVWHRRHRGELRARILIWSLIASCVLALGPFLKFAGHPVVPMPWLIVERMPLIRGALPVRLMLIAFLSLSIIVALWFSDACLSACERVVGILAVLLMLVPNPRGLFWVSLPKIGSGQSTEAQSGTRGIISPSMGTTASHSALDKNFHIPAFFYDGSSERYLRPSDIVLPLPLGPDGMLWQVQSGMNFRMASGPTGLKPGEIRRWPALDAFSGLPIPEPELQLKTFLATLGITVIIVDSASPHRSYWTNLLSVLQVAPREVSGVALYRIQPGTLEAYKAVDAATMERRAQSARFAELVAAASKYLELGPHPGMFGLGDLEAFGLFPIGKTFEHGPEPYDDIAVASQAGETAIALVGTHEGLQPIIDKYGHDARSVYFPYPRLWKPRPNIGWLDSLLQPVLAGNTTGIPLQRLVITFDRAQLARAVTLQSGSTDRTQSSKVQRHRESVRTALAPAARTDHARR